VQSSTDALEIADRAIWESVQNLLTAVEAQLSGLLNTPAPTDLPHVLEAIIAECAALVAEPGHGGRPPVTLLLTRARQELAQADASGLRQSDPVPALLARAQGGLRDLLKTLDEGGAAAAPEVASLAQDALGATRAALAFEQPFLPASRGVFQLLQLLQTLASEIEAHELTEDEIRERLRTAAEATGGHRRALQEAISEGARGVWAPPKRGPAADLAQAVAAFGVSEWIREHREDGATSWPDVVACLEYFGHEIPSKADAAGNLRYQVQNLLKRTAST